MALQKLPAIIGLFRYQEIVKSGFEGQQQLLHECEKRDAPEKAFNMSFYFFRTENNKNQPTARVHAHTFLPVACLQTSNGFVA